MIQFGYLFILGPLILPLNGFSWNLVKHCTSKMMKPTQLMLYCRADFDLSFDKKTAKRLL